MTEAEILYNITDQSYRSGQVDPKKVLIATKNIQKEFNELPREDFTTALQKAYSLDSYTAGRINSSIAASMQKSRDSVLESFKIDAETDPKSQEIIKSIGSAAEAGVLSSSLLHLTKAHLSGGVSSSDVAVLNSITESLCQSYRAIIITECCRESLNEVTLLRLGYDKIKEILQKIFFKISSFIHRLLSPFRYLIRKTAEIVEPWFQLFVKISMVFALIFLLAEYKWLKNNLGWDAGERFVQGVASSNKPVVKFFSKMLRHNDNVLQNLAIFTVISKLAGDVITWAKNLD